MAYFLGLTRLLHPQDSNGEIIAKFEPVTKRTSFLATDDEEVIEQLRNHPWHGKLFSETGAAPKSIEPSRAVIGARTSVVEAVKASDESLDVIVPESKPKSPPKTKKSKEK